MKYLKLLMAAMALSFFSCTKDDTASVEKDDFDSSSLVVSGGKVKLYLVEAKTTVHSSLGNKFEATRVLVNGEEYEVKEDAGAHPYVKVPRSEGDRYVAALAGESAARHYGADPYTGLKVPYSQFYLSTGKALKNFPMYASYSASDGNKLVFSDALGLLDIVLAGKGVVIMSIKVSSPDGALLAGISEMSGSTLTVGTGLPFVVLNCTNNGNGAPLTESGIHFRIPVVPGDYPSGLDVTVCDRTRRVMTFNIPEKSLKANGTISIKKGFVPDDDIIFYEGFDNCVWGGNYAAGSSSVAFSPTDERFTTSGGSQLGGMEDSFAAVPCDYPASGPIQTKGWTEFYEAGISGGCNMSYSYLKSRNFMDHRWLENCQEYQGCLGLGMNTESRGVYHAVQNANISGIFNGTLSLDVCPAVGFDGTIQLKLINGGYPKSVSVDGVPLELDKENLYFHGVSAIANLKGASLSIPSSALEAKKWHHIEFQLQRLTGGSTVFVSDANTGAGHHGFLIDNIVLKKSTEMKRGTLRLLYWNIQDGMWADQHNNYDNFVKWVKRYDPDICVWCEAATIYQDKTAKTIGNTGGTLLGYLPEHYPELAKRYGHNYTATGGIRDNFPQEITSKYPITTLKKITDGTDSKKPVVHGAALQQVNVNGKLLNFVTLHMWPSSYRYGCPDSEQYESMKANEGDYYREYEIKSIVEMTKNNPGFASLTDWVMLGDFNARTPDENWFYKMAESDTDFLLHKYIRNNTDYIDVVNRKYEGEMVSGSSGIYRIDFIYLTPGLFSKVKNVMCLTDDWTIPKSSEYYNNFCDPSDHRPFLVDFQL